MDIIYSKGNNIRRQACWVATEKPFPFLIGKVLTDSGAISIERLGTFPFLIGKVLTKGEIYEQEKKKGRQVSIPYR